MKKAALAALALSALVLGACDLFNAKTGEDVLAKIDESVAWANAAKLSVTINYPTDWVRSPNVGAIAEDIRKGFAFSVAAVQSDAYALVGWRAVLSGNYAAYVNSEVNAIGPDNPAYVLPEAMVKIVPSASDHTQASVTINTTEPVTLVPWAEMRPRVIQANPPLISSGLSYSRGQQIKINFSSALENTADNIKFGDGYITITAMTVPTAADPQSVPWEDGSTIGLEEGDLCGLKDNTKKYFDDPEYTPAEKLITIRPKSDPDLPPGDVVITVTVGTKVKGVNGNGMTAAVSFSYRTNNQVVSKSYYADHVWATFDSSASAASTSFFSVNSDTATDRRLPVVAPNAFKVTLYFTVHKSDASMTDEANYFNIVEQRYTNLAGGTQGTAGSTEQSGYLSLSSYIASSDTALTNYKSVASVSGATTVYKYTYTVQKTQTGVIRLLVLPVYDQNGDGTFSGSDVGPDESIASFAAVVRDTVAPGGDAVLNFDATYASASGNNYTYGSSNKNVKFTANFSGIADNGSEGGILKSHASIDKPWTMDNASDLQWQYRIAKVASPNDATPADWTTPSAYAPFTSNTANIANISTMLNSLNTYMPIQFRYKDKLGNESTWEDSGYAIKYYAPALNPVTTWSASYNENANTITLTWTNPAGMKPKLSYTINGSAIQAALADNATSYPIVGVPKIYTSGIQNGTPTQNVYTYEFTLTATSDFGDAKPTSFKIWNIPGMAFNQTTYANVVEISSLGTYDNASGENTLAGLAYKVNNGTATTGKFYVLTADIAIPSGTTWRPIGNGTSRVFNGTFYGNGHRISGVKPLDNQNYFGIFGWTQDALVRDVEVVWAASAGITNSSTTYLGGLVAVDGAADANMSDNPSSSTFSNDTSKGSQFINISVTGDIKIKATSQPAIVGGIIGRGSGSSMINSLSAENMTAESVMSIRAGGLMGNIIGGTLTDCVATGDIILTTTGSSAPWAGGLVGNVKMVNNTDTSPSSTITNCNFKIGRIEAHVNNGDMHIGGAFGYVAEYSATIESCSAGGSLVSAENAGSGGFYLGGFVGRVLKGNTIENCSAINGISANGGSFISNEIRIGGFVGILSAGCTISDCSATGNVTSVGYFNMYAGGFFGFFSGTSTDRITVSNCYAKGNVIVTSKAILSGSSGRAGGFGGYCSYTDISTSYARGNVTFVSEGLLISFEAGGFTGYTSDSAIIHCYSLGNVIADSYNGNVHAGGITGYVYASSIEYCFAMGEITAKSAVTTANVNAGGIVGTCGSGTISIQNCVALNPQITALGGTSGSHGNVKYGRIWANSSPSTSANNYAYNVDTDGSTSNDMELRTGAYTDVNFPTIGGYPGYIISPSGTLTNKDGLDTNFSTIQSSAFWQTTVGFGSTNWNCSTAYYRGYPTLVGLGGQ